MERDQQNMQPPSSGGIVMPVQLIQHQAQPQQNLSVANTQSFPSVTNLYCAKVKQSFNQQIQKQTHKITNQQLLF